jgi:hypothetical protein
MWHEQHHHHHDPTNIQHPPYKTICKKTECLKLKTLNITHGHGGGGGIGTINGEPEYKRENRIEQNSHAILLVLKLRTSYTALHS